FGRHKALDLIGDLALVGLPLLGCVAAHKAGHALHTQLVSRVLADPCSWTITTADDRPVEVLAVVEAPAPDWRTSAITAARCPRWRGFPCSRESLRFGSVKK